MTLCTRSCLATFLIFTHTFLIKSAIHFIWSQTLKKMRKYQCWKSIKTPTKYKRSQNHRFIVFQRSEIFSHLSQSCSSLLHSLPWRTGQWLCVGWIWNIIAHKRTKLGAPESFDDISNDDDVNSCHGHNGGSQHRGWRNKVKGVFHHLKVKSTWF